MFEMAATNKITVSPFADARKSSGSWPLVKRSGFQLLLLTIAGMAAAYAKMALGPLQETLRGALQLTDNQIALLQGPALVLPMLLAAVPLGLIVDRYARVRVLFLITVFLFIGSLLTAAATGFATLFAARALVGLAVFAMLPVTGSLLSDLYAPTQRGRAGVVMLIGQFAGFSAAFAVGGALVARPDWGMDAWRLAILWGMGPPLVLVILTMLALREPARIGEVIQNTSVTDSLLEVWRYRALITPLLIGQTLAVIALQSLLIWAAPTLARNFTLAPDRVGAIMAMVVPAGGIIGSIVGGILADRGQRTGGPRRTVHIAGSLALLCVPLSVFAVIPDERLACGLLAGLMAVLIAVSVIAATLLIVALPNEIRGTCLSLVTGVGAVISISVAPLLVSWLSAAIGGPSMIGTSLALVCVSGTLLCAATYGCSARYFTRAHAG
jgi:MFS family permease